MAEDDFAKIPIPTYEEATSSTPPTTHYLGPSEISDDAERQAFLTPHPSPGPRPPRRRNGYHAPSVQSVRSSEDSIDSILVGSDSEEEHEGQEDEALRRDMEEMDMDDDVEGGERSRSRRHRSVLGSRLSKRFGRWGTTLSEIRLPRVPMPSMEWLTRRLPNWKWSIPDQYRPGWQLIARLFGLFIVVGLLYVLFVLQIMPGSRGDFPFDPELLRSWAQGHVDEGHIRDNLKHITGYSHIAGSEGDLYLARWIESAFRGAMMDDVHTTEYEVYLNYPKPGGRRVAIVSPPQLAWEAKLEEESAYEHPTAQQENTLVFHGHSRAGNVTGPLVYANYGSREDYKRFHDNGIDLNGTIALVRYYGTQGDRALKVKAAEEWGVKGVLIYSDPQEDGFVKGEPWPKGRWRPSDGVQRGAVSLMSWVVGDVLTPGLPAHKDTPRISKDNNPGLVNIPSLPLAWRDAQKLLQSLKGHGEEAPHEWVGGVPDVKYWSGDQSSPVVNLLNDQDENERQPIWNVMGVIEGIEQKEKKVIVGNHRDSWCFGAGDPGSGTAIMLEVVRVLGQLRSQGWRPLRSIVFASWDAEEYNLIGSTEYVEDNLESLRNDGIAYLNVDTGVVGDDFRAAASPILKQALTRVLGRVGDPFKNASLGELWQKEKKKLDGLGAGSDYVAFQDMAGVSSIDFGFSGEGYPYHSCYETFEWMEQYGDPKFLYHKALAQIWILLILEVAQEPLVPFDLRHYALAMNSYLVHLVTYAERHGSPSKEQFNLKPLFEAVGHFREKAKEFHNWDDAWFGTVIANNGFESTAMTMQRYWHNDRISNFEADLLDLPRDKDDHAQHGVPGREQFKHIIFGPQKWSGYDEAYFPAIVDAIDEGDWSSAQAQVKKAAGIIRRASDNLTRP
ncbi:glutamate carboxypeptidase Tre2 [Rhizodiscina lignyota]|uniref:Glutamate carboxypeptidase Tre2 n=1 Tax=Rhizodiscina lignyota TaxID=1504668 RepID=A0A9P4ICQ7_9PEZI|nr:glutamate carboxypeptidase Tre2 [Rhizodiscina lignyota]